MNKRGAKAAQVFRQSGLASTGFWRSLAVPPPDQAFEAGARLRGALEELGGVYLAFARFLTWRADLLETDYLNALRRIRYDFMPVARRDVAALLRLELGDTAESLIADMEQEPVWTTLSRTAYVSWFKQQPVVVQVARPSFAETALVDFEAGIVSLGHPDIARVAHPRILREFRQWLRHAESISLERSYLEVLGRNRESTLIDYPAVIPEISTSNVLCWPWVDGETIGSLIGRGAIEEVTRIAITVLEQYCNLAIVDADMQLDSIVKPPGSDRLTIRRLDKPLSVPPPAVNNGMKYIAAVLEGNASATVQNLLTMAVGRSSANLEAELLNLISGIEPELKVRAWFPGSAAAFESNWRALGRIEVSRPRPLYLDCLHRNLIAIGYWTSDAVAAGGKTIDPIAEAQWPVVDLVLRANASQFVNPAVMTEWSVGLGLLTFGAFREANRLAEELRENNLTLEVECEPEPWGREEARGPGFRSLALVAVLLAALFAAVHWGSSSHGALYGLMVALALMALAGLFWVVRKVG